MIFIGDNMLILSADLEKYRVEIESTRQNIVTVSTVVLPHKLGILESKIGGLPYIPSGCEYPLIDGVKAKLFAQINLNNIKDFDCLLLNDILKGKNLGILQFWYQSGHDYCGLEFEKGSKNKIKVIYREDITGSNYKLNEEEISIAEADNFVVDCELLMNFSQGVDYLTIGDDYMISKLYKDFKFSEEALEYFYEMDEVVVHSKIGGYAYFTQEDPRSYMEDIPEDLVLLFQIDSDDNLMWGDSGIGNWFISKKDLENLDFTNVIFNWDCC